MASSANESGGEGPAIKKIPNVDGIKDPKDVSDQEWKNVLSPEAYDVTRQGGTEPAFTGKYDKHFKPGRYTCVCCGADLFISDHKYHSGCGWPAFFNSIDGDKNIVRIHDTSYGMERTEVRCRQCNAHLGHVFDDGPKETGERYCINSVSIDFVPGAQRQEPEEPK
ncbi:selR domain-containing protein [Ditylenchus destructor]|uniref:Peptide-methionine (R)-S-oxide reductase n=1 Tax=Ditylenchus destructor TaxID=166010 RepID=A0AAD4R8B1_9BILA|nr:selR domain-containing protein [Ditylenchus destructor]